MASERATRVGRSVLLGVAAGLLLGGLALLFWGLYAVALGPDCAPLSPGECALARELTLDLGRRQVLVGAALALLGVAILIAQRAARQT